jgi:hypothetical protein
VLAAPGSPRRQEAARDLSLAILVVRPRSAAAGCDGPVATRSVARPERPSRDGVFTPAVILVLWPHSFDA